MQEELEDLYAAQEAGIAFILGHSHVRAKQGSSVLKKLALNYGYNFLRRICKGLDVALKAPVSDWEYQATLPHTTSIIDLAAKMISEGRGLELMLMEADPTAPITAYR
ncbi:hypothetical protein JHK82_055123 [Glycine max]|nr:hypothetical protein JHK86_054965 [Glycine max]KAG4917656.1 hypothetical protein JHK85_055937 [Glycine max]KAG5073755.1 hypothetical protein JHK84_054986 [Glycine max]KAG5076428.1 hypothetical protein JHK82_055123 [Glycine max]